MSKPPKSKSREATATIAAGRPASGNWRAFISTLHSEPTSGLLSEPSHFEAMQPTESEPEQERAGGWGFQTTHWSMVAVAGGKTSPGTREAFGSLYLAYTAPLLAFLRARAVRRQDAEDIVQGFFARLLEKGGLGAVDPHRGKFRNWLLASLRNYLTNEWDKVRAVKRGGESDHVSLEEEHEDGRPKHTPASPGRTPEQEYDREFALQFLTQVKEALRQEYTMAGKTSLFVGLEPFLVDRSGEKTQKDIAREFGMTSDAVNQAVHRLRQRYRLVFDRELARLIGVDGDLEEEKQYLLASLSI